MKRYVAVIVLSAVMIMVGRYLSADAGGLVCPLDRKTAVKMMNEDHAKRVAYYTDLLKLTPDQSKKISDIMVEYRDRQLVEKDKFLNTMVAAINESDGRVKAVLTSDQIEKYEDAKAKQNDTLSQKMQNFFKSGMCY